MSLVMNLTKRGDAPYLHLAGRIIGADSKKLEKKLEALFNKGAHRNVIDISELEFLDSYGLGILVYYHTQVQKAGRALFLLNRNDNPMAYMNRLLELTRLDSVFAVVADWKDEEK